MLFNRDPSSYTWELSTQHRQWKFEFDNGYGASVICSPYSYGGEEGLFELAVLYDKHIVYDTHITDDVIGWLTEQRVSDYLDEIEKLPPKEVP